MEPRKERKAYRKINGCSHPPSLAMIIAIVLVVILIVLHALVIGAIAEIDHAILSILLAFNYVFLAVVAIDYFILVIRDPADPRLYEENFNEKEKDLDLLVMCKFCEKRVHIYSYHCRTCKRCVDQFDHHCIFLNNCIGKPNYSNFFRLLLTLSFFLLINLGEGIWVAIASEGSDRWIAVTLSIVSGLILPQVIGLMGFHCYISLCIYKTTLQVIRGEIDLDTKKRVRDYTPKKKHSGTEQVIKTEVQIKKQEQL